MSEYTESIDVDRPLRVVYDQWTQVESYPQFMDHVTAVTQHGPQASTWTVRIGGVERTFDARIAEQHADERIAWSTVGGSDHAGVVTFHHLDADTTRVTLQLDFEPDGFTETVGDKTGFVSAAVKNSLTKFKEFIEALPTPTGGWRGDIPVT